MTGCLVLLAGCASGGRAPVIERTQPQVVEPAASVELKPGQYLVTKGDTLYSIALDHGRDYKEIAAWNNIDNPDLIKIGQVLWVVQPAAASAGEPSAAEVRPVAPPPSTETLPVDMSPVAGEALKSEPKGGTQPYTDAAWARLQQPPPATTPAAAQPPQAQPIAAVAPPVASSGIDWVWPTNNPVTTSFNDGGSKGLDFNGAIGDPVLAASSGKVTLVTNSLRGYGNLIVVKHNATYLSVYAHNSKMLVSEGQIVGKGQMIAEIGSSDSDHPNLHFEIRREGKPVNPVKYLPPR